MRKIVIAFVLVLVGTAFWAKQRMSEEQRGSWDACVDLHLGSRLAEGSLFPLPSLRPIAARRADRFLGKPLEADRLRCRGGQPAVDASASPWLDWPTYWGTGDASSLPDEPFPFSLFPDRITGPKSRGVKGALIDLEFQRMELIKFNLHDSYTLRRYYGKGGSREHEWPEMQLPGEQNPCQGEKVRFRTLTGICNDVFNPRMGSTNMVFARNVEPEATFPDEPDRSGGSQRELLANRHAGRIGPDKPETGQLSADLFTRSSEHDSHCNEGRGWRADGTPSLLDAGLDPATLSVATLAAYSPEAVCDYQKAPWMNVLAAYWIQFMTHDWFSHLDEGRSSHEQMAVGQGSAERTLVADASPPGTFEAGGRERLERPPKTFRNTVTGWWDASQIYGYDETSRRRVLRDPQNRAKLWMVKRGNHPGEGEAQGYLPLLARCGEGAPADCIADLNPAFNGQEATGFPDNFSIGLSFFHNVFAREHNLFVDRFRAQDKAADSGLRDPGNPTRPIAYGEVTDDQLFEIARLVIAAEIAKIHTIEWTTQLLYDEPLYQAMNANWNGLFDQDKHQFLNGLLTELATRKVGSNQLYSVFASGVGIFGLGSEKKDWAMVPGDYNAGTHHFGSPFNFPEEFVTVYRLHPLLPDLAEFRELQDPSTIRAKVPIVETFRRGSAKAMTAGGLANWALSLGWQRLGQLTLNNHPHFLQQLTLEHLPKELDIAALDLQRDRERGIPRYNEFRRQYGLRQLTSFDDFADARLRESDPAEYQRQLAVAAKLREAYGQHRCDAAKPIAEAQGGGEPHFGPLPPIDDCLGHDDGSLVDNIEDLDAVVGWLAEFRRPHGFAISETQFMVFILNASRRLFSDRFFTSSFRPELYSSLGHDWVNFNGPCAEGKMKNGRCFEQEMAESNGHPEPVSPLKRILLRTIPELSGQLEGVINVFDPWTRDRGEYYSLAWNEPAKPASP